MVSILLKTLLPSRALQPVGYDGLLTMASATCCHTTQTPEEQARNCWLVNRWTAFLRLVHRQQSTVHTLPSLVLATAARCLVLMSMLLDLLLDLLLNC